MTDLVQEFCEHHFAYNDISASRRRQQPKAIRAFEASLDCELADAGGDDLLTYLATRIAAGLQPSTIAKELNMIRPFFAWAYGKGHVTGDQLMSLREVKPPRGASASAPRPYPEKELRAFWRQFETAYPWARDGGLDRAEFYLDRWQRGTSGWVRVAPFARRLQAEAIIGLALHGGLRKNEIFRLQLEEMHHENDYLVVRGARKNREGREELRAVPWVVPMMRDNVRRWLEFRALLTVPHDRPWLTLRPSQHALNAMQDRAFGMILCEIGTGWEFHRLRHTAATEMLRADYRVEEVRDILGHADIKMTMRYVKLVEGDLLRAATRNEGALTRRMNRIRHPEEGRPHAA